MKKIPVILKIIPVTFAIPFLLTACEELKSLFGDSSRSSGYDSSYSSQASPAKNKSAPTKSVKPEVMPSPYSKETTTTTNQSGTVTTDGAAASGTDGAAAATANSPISTETKTNTGTVDAPIVPSTAPTVGQ